MNLYDSILLDTLSLNTGSSLGELRAALAVAVSAGARPFEVIAGAPHRRYGARLTVVPAPGTEARLAAAFELEHPWGPPTWLGLRALDDRLSIKPYHRITRIPEQIELPGGVRDDLVPQLAALDGDRIEIYMRSTRERSWRRFVTESQSLWLDAPGVAANPLPRPAGWNHAVSYRYARGRLDAVTVFADGRALPDERRVRAGWIGALGPDDAACYERLVAAVCTYGRLASGATNAMLGWSIDAGGAEQRAVSLAIPVRFR